MHALKFILYFIFNYLYQGAVVRRAIALAVALVSFSFSATASINTSKLKADNLHTASVSTYVMDLSAGRTLYKKKFQSSDAYCFNY